MHIANLCIDHFGPYDRVELDELDKGLNVIAIPPGFSDAMIVQFLRAMLFGFDAHDAGGDGPTSPPLSAGSLTLRGPFGHRTVSRRIDGAAGNCLVMQDQDGKYVDYHDMCDLLAGIPRSLFDRVFAPGFVSRPDIGKLIDAVHAYGFSLAIGPGDELRLGQLQEELAQRRQRLAELVRCDLPLPQLADRRRDLQQQIQSMETTTRRRRETLERQLHELTSQIDQSEKQREEDSRQLAELETEIQGHADQRRRTDEALAAARRDLEEMLARRQERLAEIDAQLIRRQRVLQDLEAQIASLAPEPATEAALSERAAVDPRRWLQRLEENVDRLQGAIGAAGVPNAAGQPPGDRLQDVAGPALQAMRDDVYRLCNHLARWEAASTIGVDDQRDQLRRCTMELQKAIQSLSARRRALASEPASDGDPAQIGLHPEHEKLCRCIHHPRLADQQRSLRQTMTRYEQTLAAIDARVEQLARRRDALRTKTASLSHALGHLQARCEPIRRELHEIAQNRRLASARRELEQVQQQMADVERRQGLTAAIAELEAEIGKTEHVLQPSVVLREASDVLRRTTEGRLCRIFIAPDGGVWVSDRQDDRVAYDHLGSAARDQVYLSLCTALVATLARRGTHLPLILGDALLHLDAGRLETTAALLSDFALRGHQVLVLTRHQRAVQWFRTLGAAVHHLSLIPAGVPIHTPCTRAGESSGPADPPAWNSEEFPGELTDRVRLEPAAGRAPSVAEKAADEATPENRFLTEDSPIQDAPSIDSATAERLRKIGVLVVRDLLQLDVEEAAERLRYAGITSGMLRRWRAESLLTCRVSGLRPYDARILVGCGITDPDQLEHTDAEDLRRRVEAFGASNMGQVLLRSGTPHELARVKRWIRAAHARKRRAA